MACWLDVLICVAIVFDFESDLLGCCSYLGYSVLFDFVVAVPVYLGNLCHLLLNCLYRSWMICKKKKIN